MAWPWPWVMLARFMQCPTLPPSYLCHVEYKSSQTLSRGDDGTKASGGLLSVVCRVADCVCWLLITRAS